MNTAATIAGKTFNASNHLPLPGSEEEKAQFNLLQEGFKKQFEEVFPDKLLPRTVIIIPSFTLDSDILAKITGIQYYEERMLCLLMLLRMPQTKIVYVSSLPIAEVIIDYYLHLLPGITGHHAKKRLTLLNCFDAASNKSLTQKILERPRLLQRIREQITDVSNTHLTCFNITPLEKTLAVQLGVPLFGTDPDKFYEGSKSGARKTFRECGVDLPDGYEDLHTKTDIAHALADLKKKYPLLRKAVIKMNDGFSGDGNAIYRYDADATTINEQSIEATLLQSMTPVSSEVSRELFLEKFNGMGGIVEVFLDGDIKTSPSVQCVINPNKTIDIVSTHDQLLGGDDGQIFIGAIFPADKTYSVSLAAEGKKVAGSLAAKGALGRFAIDFLSLKQEDGQWKHYAIEINLRKGGTTHPFLMLQFLTNGAYNADTGSFVTASGNERYYFASDNVQNENYKGLTPYDLINIAMYHSLMYDGAAQEGVMFHLIGALSEFGKLGLVCIGSSPERARAFYDKVLQVLDHECCL